MATESGLSHEHGHYDVAQYIARRVEIEQEVLAAVRPIMADKRYTDEGREEKARSHFEKAASRLNALDESWNERLDAGDAENAALAKKRSGSLAGRTAYALERQNASRLLAVQVGTLDVADLDAAFTSILVSGSDAAVDVWVEEGVPLLQAAQVKGGKQDINITELQNRLRATGRERAPENLVQYQANKEVLDTQRRRLAHFRDLSGDDPNAPITRLSTKIEGTVRKLGEMPVDPEIQDLGGGVLRATIPSGVGE